MQVGPQPRPQGLLAFQYGGGSGEGRGDPANEIGLDPLPNPASSEADGDPLWGI